MPALWIFSFTLVESIPANLTYPAGSPSFPSTFNAWRTLMSNAKKTIDIASFYWSLRGVDDYSDPTDWEVSYMRALFSLGPLVCTGFYPDLKKLVLKIAIGSFYMKSTRVIPHEIDWFLDNHSINHTEVS